jgi:hypothetical protein
MIRFALQLGVALLAFAIGLLAHKATLMFPFEYLDQEQMFSVAELSEDDWHKLYEAAMVSSDESIRSELHSRSMCMGPDHLLDAWLVEVDATTYCVKRGGNLNERLARLPGKFHYALLHQHHQWTLRNIAFLEEINTPQKARAYLSGKDWESY